MAVTTGINAIETSFVESYTSNVELLLQQKRSKLRSTVRTESFVGKSADFMEQVGIVAAVKRVTRHGDTPLVPTPMDRRWVFPTDYELADLIDDQDKLRNIIDPTSPFAQAQAAALGRSMDDAIIEGALGTNTTGENSSGSTVTFDSNNLIVAGGTGLTIDKLRQVRQGMAENEVDFDSEMAYAIITPAQLTNLLETTEITSSDYNTVKALVQGEVNTFMGFEFVVSNRLPGGVNYSVDGTISVAANTSRALFYPMSGIGFGLWNDISARVDERADKSYSTQVYTKATFGATRIEEGKVFAADALNAQELNHG